MRTIIPFMKDYFWFWHYICNLTQQKDINLWKQNFPPE